MVADRTGFPGGVRLRDDQGGGRVDDAWIRDRPGRRGITVNNVQPGPTETDMNPKDGPHYDWLSTCSR